MELFNFQGSKAHDLKSYQTINYIEKLVDSVTQEEVNTFNFALGVIHRWICLVIEARKNDIVSRLAQCKQMREAREQKIEEKNKMVEEYNAAKITEQEKFETDHKEEIEKYLKYKEAIEAGEDL